MNLIGYVRVSTTMQGESGLGLEAQEAAIRAYADLHGHEIVHWCSDVASGARNDREGFEDAMDRLRKKQAQGVVVAKLDRLTRSLGQFAVVMETSHKQGWHLIALDLGVDTTTAAGKAMCGVLAVFAQFERDCASERTKAAVERRRERLGGVLPGTRPSAPDRVRNRVRRLRDKGLTLAAIAQKLEDEGVPTAQGGRWHPGTVKWVLEH